MMGRHFCTKHPYRGRSTYHRKGKGAIADRYGEFRPDGTMKVADRIAGRTLFYRGSNSKAKDE